MIEPSEAIPLILCWRNMPRQLRHRMRSRRTFLQRRQVSVDQFIVDDRRFRRIVCTDSIPLADDQILPQTKILTVAPLLGEAIKRIDRNESVSRLFQ